MQMTFTLISLFIVKRKKAGIVIIQDIYKIDTIKHINVVIRLIFQLSGKVQEWSCQMAWEDTTDFQMERDAKISREAS